MINFESYSVNDESQNNLYSSEANTEWKIEIPKIELNANIAEGTSKEILDEFVGHFDNTRKRKWKYWPCRT